MEILHALWNRRFSALIALAIVAPLFTPAVANAGCGDPRGSSQQAITLSWLQAASRGTNNPGQVPTIVGLWHLQYTTEGGSPFLESFKTWHSDGTEFENAFLPPTGGNICYGVWKQIGPRTVRLHHVGLMFNPDGTISSTFTVDETNTVSSDNGSYAGSFDFKVFAPNGDQVAEVKGTTAGTRITVD
jgi:hypothetical protein